MSKEQKENRTTGVEPTPAELLKQMNDYIHEEKEKLKKGEE